MVASDFRLPCMPFQIGALTQSPTGVLIDGASLIAVESDYKMQVRKINVADGMDITTVGSEYGDWDGIEMDGASYLISDVSKARLFRFDAQNGTAQMVRSFSNDGLASAADIGWDARARRLGVPDTVRNQVFILTLP